MQHLGTLFVSPQTHTVDNTIFFSFWKLSEDNFSETALLDKVLGAEFKICDEAETHPLEFELLEYAQHELSLGHILITDSFFLLLSKCHSSLQGKRKSSKCTCIVEGCPLYSVQESAVPSLQGLWLQQIQRAWPHLQYSDLRSYPGYGHVHV